MKQKNIKKIDSKSQLAILLSKIGDFPKAKIDIEQYPTDSEIAAEVLWNMVLIDPPEGKVRVDLGSGTGILGIGLLLLGTKKVYFIDQDLEALNTAKKHLSIVKSEGFPIGKAIFKQQDIKNLKPETFKKVDLVIQNPPFGTKVRHIDTVFLEKAFKIAPIVYSFHKSETRNFIEKFAEKNDFKVSHRWDFNFPLKARFAFHRRKIHRIKVSCFRFEKIYK